MNAWQAIVAHCAKLTAIAEQEAEDEIDEPIYWYARQSFTR